MKLTAKQNDALRLLGGPAKHQMLFGGSRSGKTFLFVRAICVRAIKAAGSRHAILRFRFNAVKASIILDTFPKVMQLCFPGVEYRMDKQDWIAHFSNGSQVWFGGLDDKERTEKVLGMEFCTIYLNECSQIPKSSRDLAVTRLAQSCMTKTAGEDDRPLSLRMYYDCVSGDTILDGQIKTIQELSVIGMPIMVRTTHGDRLASAPWKSGAGYLLEVKTDSCKSIKVSPSHQFWTDSGWKQAKDITIGTKILCHAQPQTHGDSRDVPLRTRKHVDFGVSYCKYLRQCDEQLPLAVGPVLACPASSFDGEAHIRYPFRHDLSGFRMILRDLLGVQHIRHILEFLVPLGPLFALSPGHIAHLSGLPISVSSQQIHQSFRRPGAMGSRLESAKESLTLAPLRCRIVSYLASICDALAIGKQWLRYSLRSWLSLGQTSLAATMKGVRLLACDTPLLSGCKYETVEDINLSSSESFYTVYVPGCNHYIAGGVVSHNCNPPSKGHWTYKLFVQNIDPESKLPIQDRHEYCYMQINPVDNLDNLPPDYIGTLKGLSTRLQKRFLLGEFADDNPNSLFPEEFIDKWRHVTGPLPDFQRIVIGVDPSGSRDKDNTGNDAIGILVGALGTDGNAYLSEDCTVKAGPGTWGKIATGAFDRHQADVIVGEENFGGAMVEFVIQTARPKTPYRNVHASRGKVVRAEPFSALYEQGKVRHVGYFNDLEDELEAMSTIGYTGEGSPNRADAWIWVLTELFPGIVNPRQAKKEPVEQAPIGWMG